MYYAEDQHSWSGKNIHPYYRRFDCERHLFAVLDRLRKSVALHGRSIEIAFGQQPEKQLCFPVPFSNERCNVENGDDARNIQSMLDLGRLCGIRSQDVGDGGQDYFVLRL